MFRRSISPGVTLGGVIESRNASQEHLHQVIARSGRDLDSEEQVEQLGEFRVGDEFEESSVASRTRSVEAIFHG